MFSPETRSPKFFGDGLCAAVSCTGGKLGQRGATVKPVIYAPVIGEYTGDLLTFEIVQDSSMSQPNELFSRITVDPEICHGKPTIRGLRYPVSMILELLSGGMTEKEILADYDDLTADDIKACLAFGARLANGQRILPLAATL